MADRDNIIRMAREAGLAPYHPALGLRDDQQLALERFARLVKADAVAAEREACALLCEGMHEEDRPGDYAYAIRARGQHG